jgi:hypothetical protein
MRPIHVWRSRTPNGVRCAHFPSVITTIMDQKLQLLKPLNKREMYSTWQNPYSISVKSGVPIPIYIVKLSFGSKKTLKVIISKTFSRECRLKQRYSFWFHFVQFIFRYVLKQPSKSYLYEYKITKSRYN